MHFNNLDIPFTIDSTVFSTVSIGRGVINSDIPKHCHSSNSYEIHYILEGEGSLITNDSSYEIKPNTLYITGPHFEHEQISSPKCRMMEITIYMEVNKNPQHIGDHIERLSELFLDTIFWFGQDKQNLNPLFQSLLKELDEQIVGYDINAQCLLQQITIGIIRNYKENQKSRTVIATKDLSNNRFLAIEVAFLSEYRDITLSGLSERLGICTRQAERLIEKHYKMKFTEKRIQARNAAALLMLKNTTMSIADIAEASGFSSPEHFSTVFKKYHQVTPKKYRHQLEMIEQSACQFVN